MIDENALMVIVSSQEGAEILALSELQKIDAKASSRLQIAPGIQVVYIPLGYGELVKKIKQAPPIFIRHLFPLNEMLTCDRGGELLFRQTIGHATVLGHRMDSKRSYTVQIKMISKNDRVKKSDIAAGVTVNLDQAGFVQNNSAPDQVLTILYCHNRAYLGLSYSNDNISPWVCGEHRFKKKDTISRAEFKLLEAISELGITIPVGGTALDLGAAPGGWTKVLLEHDMNVCAVDPAALNPVLAGNPKLKHFRLTAQNFDAEPSSFDLIVNDMKMDIRESAGIMLDMCKYLKDGGAAVMTLKLSEGHWYKKTKDIIRFLEKRYELCNARQLFHNRQEVTLYMKKSNGEKGCTLL